ncbi:MAG TPA: pentapeptide repeat-containing protein [Candidatus Limnocylindrales bacterium]|nr:pentapeptide repeat-containing protein [Candidatus Limnocylindrales bacterium]
MESTTVPAEERQEREEIVEKRASEAPEGMVLAEDLPSAADALADLFSEDAPAVPAGANGTAVGATPTAVQSDTKPANETHAPPPPTTDAEAAEPVTIGTITLELGPPSDLELAGIELAASAINEAATVEAPANAEAVAIASATPANSGSADSHAAPTIPLAASDWAFEERLAAHKEWVETRGVNGNKANFAGAALEGAEMIGVNLRYADLQDANLKSADLLLADLRDACLVRADLQESCLVGANLEGANLEGASLDTAMGLVPRQLAGANLRDASLPEQVAHFEARPEFERASQAAKRFFGATMAISGVSALMIWMTHDTQLLTDSSILPFLRSRAASSALPAGQIYLIAPVVLFIVYLVLHFHLQRLWDAALELPGIFPDGREIGQGGPRIVTGLLRAHFRWMNREAASTRIIERALAMLLAYWVAPATLLLFWARYLTVQDLHGTMLHEFLLVIAAGVALYSTTKVGRPQERWSLEGKHRWQWVSKLRDVNPLSLAIGFGVVLTILAIGTTQGAPHDRARAPQFGSEDIRRWAPTVFWSIGYDPYADLTEASLSTRPANWTGTDEQIAQVHGARLNNRSMRYAQAYGIFLVNAHLWQANFEGAFLSDADFRGADMGQSKWRYAIMDRALLNHANLDRSTLDGANLDRADLRDSNLSYCSMANAILIDAQLQRASLYGARLTTASMERANLEKADVRSAYLNAANLDHADLQQTYLWSAKLSGANLQNAQLGSTIFIDADLRGADFRGAQFSDTVLNGADISGANLDGVDLRGAMGLTASQVCSTASRKGATLTDALAAQVQAACGGPLLVAPAATAPAPAAAAAQVQSQANPHH